MTSFQNIVVATDCSAASDQAIETAAALAMHADSNLTMLHVFDNGSRSPTRSLRAARQAATDRLDQTIARLRGRGVRASTLLRQGAPAEEICSAATQLCADLVVVGSRGRQGLPRLVLGSVAARVVRMSRAPVLTVHRSEGGATFANDTHRFRHILAPTDFSAASRPGVDAALALAVELHATLTLVHIYELPICAYYVLADISTEAESRARRRLDELLVSVRRRVPGADGVVRQGFTWESILDVARDIEADLVVLSTHGRHGIARVLSGSIAEKVVQLAPIPVLTVGAASRSAP